MWQLKTSRGWWLFAAKSLQSCLTLCNPIDGSHQAPPSLGFSRQEHGSGLPFSSPMHESEKWKWSRSVLSDSQWLHGLHAAYQAPPSMGFSRQEYWSGVPSPSLINLLMYLNYWVTCTDRGPKWPSPRFRNYFGKMVWVPKIMITISLNDCFDAHCCISLDLCFL